MLFMSYVFHAFASVHCCLVVTCWEGLTSCLTFVIFNCVFVTFPCGILGQVWYLIVSIPDLATFLTLYTIAHVSNCVDPYKPSIPFM